jgi:hypothetical protein
VNSGVVLDCTTNTKEGRWSNCQTDMQLSNCIATPSIVDALSHGTAQLPGEVRC